MTEKERILKIVEQMPDSATAEDVMNELYFKEIVDRGLSDLTAGRLISHDEAKQRLAQWLEK
jgi:predicted transcriptional regulator